MKWSVWRARRSVSILAAFARCVMPEAVTIAMPREGELREDLGE